MKQSARCREMKDLSSTTGIGLRLGIACSTGATRRWLVRGVVVYSGFVGEESSHERRDPQ